MGVYRSAEYRATYNIHGDFDTIVREAGGFREVRHGDTAIFDFNDFSFDPLSDTRPATAGDLRVRWDLAFRTPNGSSYGVIDVVRDDPHDRELFLVHLATEEGEEAELLSHLTRGSMTTAAGPDMAWMCGVGVTADGKLLIMHSGEGSTDIVGALSGNMAERDPMAVQMWAPSPGEIRGLLYGQ